MPILDICKRDVITADRNSTIQQAAALMRRHHVGSIVVTEYEGSAARPVGMITDRDIVVEIVSEELNPAELKLGDVITEKLVVASDQQGVFETIQQMRRAGVRRMPICNGRGEVTGIVSLDDLFRLLANELGQLANVIGTEQRREAHARV